MSLLYADITDRCVNSEIYSNLTHFGDKVNMLSIVVSNIQTLS
jgi:hypothetical protein